MKVTYTQTLARKILLAFLAFVILLSVAALFVRNSISKKLESISNLSNTNESDQSEPEKVLMLLHKADNDFQESLVNTNKKKRVDYKTELSLAFGKIDTLLKKQTDTTNLTLHQRVKVRDWYDKKLILSNKLFILKHGFDSLLTVYANFNTPSVGNQPLLSTTVNSGKTDVKISADTVKKAAQKKGLMKRLKDAIVNKDAGTAGVAEIHHNKSSKETDIATQKIVTKNNIAYNKKLQQLQQQNVKLLNTQRQLIILNTHIINELDGIINDIKDINYTIADEFKGMALNSYQESTSLLNMLYLIALFLVLAFAGLLIIFIIQLNKSELHLRKEVERSVAIAQQKMELLHHMSHEIRNPLTAIKGFLYIFSKSNMSSKQLEMLESITLSSDMMLRTLTDTLDAAKMESSELKINTEPFNPDFTLKKTVESTAFSATKKKLSLDYNFIGNKDTVLIGDSFRLKQIVVNLLSNAIKYTQQGSITVNAQLLPGSDNRLQVDVIDTGAGISLEQQANLFSKYYQTNSSKGQVGTGLGLFICKQLVKLQGGKISVKSNQGAGTTFTFFIPYQKSNNPVVVNDTNDLLSLLSGKSILAVDDNQLNLMFLKKMTEKWNVIFHQASNGNEALDIISKHEITIILTDLQMPEMDGEMLLSKIKKLSEPLNRIPVIVISGNIVPADQERIFKMGFSGIVSKPFVETELMDQFMNVLGRNEA